MEREIYEKNAGDLALLLCSVLNEKKPDEKTTSGLDLTSLFEVAKAHMLEAAAGAALESAGIVDPAFHEAYSRAIRNETLREMESSRVYAEFDAAGVWYLPLKGTVMKELYPIFGIRQMSDVDVLIDRERADDVAELMKKAGYEMTRYGEINQDVYKKAPIHNFEIHRYLVRGTAGDVFFDYYADVKDRLIPDGGMRYRFSPEDMYIYMLVHEYKHYSRGGTGLRSLCDEYLYLKKYADTLDPEYVARELKKLSLTQFEEQNRRTALALFGDGEVEDRDREFLRYVTFSGTYGTTDNQFANKIRESGRLGYLRERIFLPMSEVSERYPFFYRHRIFLPALFVYRIGRMLTVRSRESFCELKKLIKFKK